MLQKEKETLWCVILSQINKECEGTYINTADYITTNLLIGIYWEKNELNNFSLTLGENNFSTELHEEIK